MSPIPASIQTARRTIVQIEVGYELNYELPQPTPMLLAVHIHHSRAADLVVPDHLVTFPSVPITGYDDLFGNWISRIVAPAGQFRLSGHAIVHDTGRPDMISPSASQCARLAGRNLGLPAWQPIL
jgi:hypothetical protein